MIRLWLHERAVAARWPHAAYGIAGQPLVCDEPLIAAEAFAIPCPAQIDEPLLTDSPQPVRGERIYGGPAWIGGRWLDVEARRLGEGYGLTVDQVGEFEIAAGGECVRSLGELWSSDRVLVESTLLGPVLLLALALRQRWALHASAAALSCGVTAFLADSGVGKSTLAAGLAASGWQPAADDLLPLRLTRAGAEALPRYPQLKLERQWGLELPAALPLCALFLLRPREEGQVGGIAIERVGARTAATTLARFTFVKFLFDRQLLASHLIFCTELAQRIPMYRIAYPRRLDAIPEIARRVAAVIGAAE